MRVVLNVAKRARASAACGRDAPHPENVARHTDSRASESRTRGLSQPATSFHLNARPAPEGLEGGRERREAMSWKVGTTLFK